MSNEPFIIADETETVFTAKSDIYLQVFGQGTSPIEAAKNLAERKEALAALAKSWRNASPLDSQ